MGGWLYEIVGDYCPDEPVPSTAIRGAWKVGDAGLVEGGADPGVGGQAVGDVRDRCPVGCGQAAGHADPLAELVVGVAERGGQNGHTKMTWGS